MTRLVFISDTHLTRPSLPEGDILIHCGDHTYDGSAEQCSRALKWLGEQDFSEIITIAGNHDWLAEKNPSLFWDLCDRNNIIWLNDGSIELDGIKFYGSAWTPFFNDWAFNGARTLSEHAMYNKPLMKDIWEKIPNDTQVLLTHGPAYMMLDECMDTRRVGCQDLFQAILDRPSIKIHASGHIHAAYGEKLFNGVHYINASICDERYRATNLPIEVQI